MQNWQRWRGFQLCKPPLYPTTIHTSSPSAGSRQRPASQCQPATCCSSASSAKGSRWCMQLGMQLLRCTRSRGPSFRPNLRRASAWPLSQPRRLVRRHRLHSSATPLATRAVAAWEAAACPIPQQEVAAHRAPSPGRSLVLSLQSVASSSSDNAHGAATGSTALRLPMASSAVCTRTCARLTREASSSTTRGFHRPRGQAWHAFRSKLAVEARTRLSNRLPTYSLISSSCGGAAARRAVTCSRL